jgi:hypothetical protein
MDINVWLAEKYELCLTQRHLPIEIPNTNRDTLAHLFHVWGFTSGVEVGVERGLYSEVLCRENPGVRLYCVDPWRAHRGYRDHVNQDKLDGFCVEAGERLKPYPRATLVRKFSVDAAKDLGNGSLDFAYLDGNHNIENVIADLAAWTPKVRTGGIIAGHDFARHKWPNQIHVVQALGAWTAAYDIAPWFVLGSQAKVEGQLRDGARSWFYVKQDRPVLPQRRKPIGQ